MKKVVIIGGGLSGLTAGYLLLKSRNYKVTILEKNSYLGGRILSQQYEDYSIDLGGFIILPWYKYFLKLVKELDLEKNLTRHQNFYEYFFDHTKNEFIDLSKESLDFRIILKIILRITPAILLGKLKFYNANYSIFNAQSTSNFLTKLLGPDNKMLKFNDQIAQSFTYAPLENTLIGIQLPLLVKMHLGYFDKGFIFENGTSSIIKALEQKIRDLGGEIVLNCEVKNILSNHVSTEKASFESDITITANYSESLFSKALGFKSKISYTNNYCVYVELENPAEINQNLNWIYAYIAGDLESNILSIYNLRGISNKHSGKVVGIFLRSHEVDTLDDANLLALLDNDLSKYIKNKVVRIIAKKHWRETMPILTRDFLDEVNAKQGKGNIYYVGDYLGAPSMEIAAFSAFDVVKKIIESSK